MAALDKELDRLFALPREEFTAARNALAARLKKEGDPEAGARVKALAKPTAAAAALNRVARDEPRLVERLRSAGKHLAKAQAAALAGRGTGDLRTATAAKGEAVRDLIAAVEKADALSPSVRDAVRSSLNAAALDAQAGELLARGRLSKELEAVGFPAAGSLPRAASDPSPGVEDARKAKERKAAEERLRRARGELAEAKRETGRYAREAERARRDAEQREQAHQKATERQRQLADEVAKLQAELGR
jgi:hypothetical protein